MTKYDLAQVNIGGIRAQLDHPIMAGFVGGLTRSMRSPMRAGLRVAAQDFGGERYLLSSL